MIVIDRYDPRKDKEEILEIFEDFIENKSYFFSYKERFESELNKRVLDLKYRNSIILARENGKIVGAGFVSTYIDILGNENCLIHQVMTRKEDSYKRSIEERIIRELMKYIKTTLKINKAYIKCRDSDSALRSLLLKLGIKKSKEVLYEIEL